MKRVPINLARSSNLDHNKVKAEMEGKTNQIISDVQRQKRELEAEDEHNLRKLESMDKKANIKIDEDVRILRENALMELDVAKKETALLKQ